MTIYNLYEHGDHFEILLTTERSQSARFVLDPGEASSDEPSVHPKSDQIVVILEGELVGEIGGDAKTLKKGDVVVVPANTPHIFRNRTRKRVVTFTCYAPPAYPSAA